MCDNEKIDPKIINISKRNLSDIEIRLLNRGLKFTPTPKRNTTDLIKDTEEFCNKLRLREYFENDEINEDSIVRNKSKFKPPLHRDKHLEQYISCLKGSAASNKKESNIRDNISKQERSAIDSLRNDTSIVTKQADKGGAIVIMDKEHYKRMVNDHVNNLDFYSETNISEDAKTMRKINNFTEKYKESLTSKEKDYLTKFEMKHSNFYGLPKIHKSKEIQEGIQLQNSSYIKLPEPHDLKLRPIVAGPACPTHRLSNLLDIILKPLCPHVNSYIRDDIDFLNYIPESVTQETLLVSFDVTSLYTNIPNSFGYEAISYWIDKLPDSLDTRFSKEFIMEGLKLILENNNFFFDNVYYHQNRGTAMGTKVAPTYATLVMGYFEELLYSEISRSFDHAFTDYIKKNWKRFLDDCFVFWIKSVDDLKNFHSILNSIHASIQFTIETGTTKLPFLDILILKHGTDIITDIYYKNTDTHQYLTFDSCHPSHTKRNIPFNIARRICTIVSDKSIREERLSELQLYLLKQNYPTHLIEEAISKSSQIPQNELRQPKTKNKCENNIPFVITHNPRNSNILKTARDFFPILQQSEKMKTLIRPQDIINSRRQPPNLKKLLCRAHFTSDGNECQVTKCGDPRCGTCAHLQTGTIFYFQNNKSFKVNANMNCKSKNLLYCMTCSSCGKQYIGQTGNKLSDRVRVHKQQIRDPSIRNTNCSTHFDTCCNGKFSIFPFYKVTCENEYIRKAKEDFFINIFKPKLNK